MSEKEKEPEVPAEEKPLEVTIKNPTKPEKTPYDDFDTEPENMYPTKEQIKEYEDEQ